MNRHIESHPCSHLPTSKENAIALRGKRERRADLVNLLERGARRLIYLKQSYYQVSRSAYRAYILRGGQHTLLSLTSLLSLNATFGIR